MICLSLCTGWLDLSRSGLTGTIPSEINNLTSLGEFSWSLCAIIPFLQAEHPHVYSFGLFLYFTEDL
jgi:hypothetical protein